MMNERRLRQGLVLNKVAGLSALFGLPFAKVSF